LPFVFLAGLNRRYFQKVQPPQRLFIFSQTRAAAELNTQSLTAFRINAGNRRRDNKWRGNGIRRRVGITVIQPGLRQRRTVGGVRELHRYFFFISWINKAGAVNNNIIGMGRKTKNETEKRAIRFMLTSE
jgi:hypothetical protein